MRCEISFTKRRRNRSTAQAPTIANPCPALIMRNGWRSQRFALQDPGNEAMLVMKERQPPFRTAERWARLVLLEVGAIRECEEHGWMRDRSDPHACERALFIARHEPPLGISSARTVATVRDVLDTIGDTCPECPPE